MWSARPKPPWLIVKADSGIAGTAQNGAVAKLDTMLRGAIDGAAASGGEAIEVKLALRDGMAQSAEVSGRGDAVHVALGATSMGTERLLVEVATRVPAAVPHATIALPAQAERAFADAGSLLSGSSTLESIDRAIAMLESVLSVAPTHTGALRMYASAQRARAIGGRDPRQTRERRSIARTALSRAVAADPLSGAIAADVAAQLSWGDGDREQARDWYAVALREAPQDSDLLHAYAWFSLADDRAADAMQAMNSALAIAPLSIDLHSDLGWFYFRTGRYEDALRQCRIVLGMAAANVSAQICEERSLAELGRDSEAWQALRGHAPPWLDERTARELDALTPAQAYRSAMHVHAGKVREQYGAGFDSACLEAIAGNRDAAVADLAVAAELGDPELYLARVTPELVRLLGAAEARRLAGFDSRPLIAKQSG